MDAQMLGQLLTEAPGRIGVGAILIAAILVAPRIIDALTPAVLAVLANAQRRWELEHESRRDQEKGS